MTTPDVARTNRASSPSRAGALALALVLVVACVPDIAYAFSGDRDGCALAKSDSSRTLVFVDLTGLPSSAFGAAEPTPARDVVLDRPSARTLTALAEPPVPRAPPLG